MYGYLKNKKSSVLRRIIHNPDKIKILAIIHEFGEDRYVIEADWHGCTDPNSSCPSTVKFIDKSIKRELKNEFESLYNAYWVSEEDIGLYKYECNKHASHLLSKEF